MEGFRFLDGDLLTGSSAEDNENINDGENMYHRVVFESEYMSFEFRSGIGGYYPLEDSHLMIEDQNEVYYPHINETQMTPYLQSTEELTQFKKDVSIKYTIVSGDLYVVSQNDITAYGPIFFHINGVPYAAKDPLLVTPEESYKGDKFLGIDSVDQPIQVENIRTGYSNPIEYDTLSEIIQNDKMNGLLKLEEPNDVLSAITNEL